MSTLRDGRLCAASPRPPRQPDSWLSGLRPSGWPGRPVRGHQRSRVRPGSWRGAAPGPLRRPPSRMGPGGTGDRGPSAIAAANCTASESSYRAVPGTRPDSNMAAAPGESPAVHPPGRRPACCSARLASGWPGPGLARQTLSHGRGASGPGPGHWLPEPRPRLRHSRFDSIQVETSAADHDRHCD